MDILSQQYQKAMNFSNNPRQSNENEIFWPEIMNTSRVTNRGGTYSSKSKSSSSVFSNEDVWKESKCLKNGPNSMRFSENSVTVGVMFNQHQSLSVLSDIGERTNKKSPVYRQENFEEKKCQTQKVNSLLYSELSKRTFKQFQPKKRFSLFQQFTSNRNLFSIKQELQPIPQSRISASSIDTNPQNRFSNETDILVPSDSSSYL